MASLVDFEFETIMKFEKKLIIGIICIQLTSIFCIISPLVYFQKHQAYLDYGLLEMEKASETLNKLTYQTNTIVEIQDWKRLTQALSQYGAFASAAQKAELQSDKKFMLGDKASFYGIGSCSFINLILLLWLLKMNPKHRP
jgi:predicted RND superfamily exporter protein